MENKKIKIGFIGCGWIVENAHIPAFSMIEDVVVNSVFDIDINRAQRLAVRYNIPNVFDDIKNFFDSGLDAVIIATPNNTHVEYSLLALQQGIHVLCEKPIALYVDEVRNLIEIAKRENKVYIPGFVNRFRHDIMKINELLQEERIGNICKVEAGWLRGAGIPRPGTWFTNKAYSGGGVLMDLGSHIIDICMMIIGDQKQLSHELIISNQDKKSREINAQWFNSDYTSELQIDVEDTVIARVLFEEDISLNLQLSWAAGIEGDCTYFVIHGTKGRITLKTLFGFSDERLWENDCFVLEENNENGELIFADKNSNNTKNAFRDMAKFYIDLVIGKDTTYLTSLDGLKTVELIEKLYNSKRYCQIECENIF